MVTDIEGIVNTLDFYAAWPCCFSLDELAEDSSSWRDDYTAPL